MSDFRNPGYVATLSPESVIGKSGFHGGGGVHHHGFRGGFYPLGGYPIVIVDSDDDLAAANRFRGEDFVGFDDSRDRDPDFDPTGGWMSKTGGVR